MNVEDYIELNTFLQTAHFKADLKHEIFFLFLETTQLGDLLKRFKTAFDAYYLSLCSLTSV